MGVRTIFGRAIAAIKLLSTYSTDADSFWLENKAKLIEDLYSVLTTKKETIRSEVKDYATRLSFPHLDCEETEVIKFYDNLAKYGEKELVVDVIESGSNTNLIKMLTIPALVAINGMRIDKTEGKRCLSAFYPLVLSCDMADRILDNEVPSPPNTSILPQDWETAYKIIEAGLYHLSMKQFSPMSLEIQKRVDSGISKVSKAEDLDIKARRQKEVPIWTLDEIYDGKIAEIEGTVFGCLNILSSNRFPSLENGARYLAVEAQIYDDYKDLLGEDNTNPHIPNPSYFLTFSRDYCKDVLKTKEKLEDEDLDKIILSAAIDTKTKGMEYHQKVKGEFDKLDPSFATKNELEVIVEEMNKKLLESHENFTNGRNFDALKRELEELVST